MNSDILSKRIREFVIRITNLIGQLPETKISGTIAGQIFRSATSIGANYRAACRAKSRRDFINKMKIVEEETDETIYWLDLLVDCKQVKKERILDLQSEADQLLAIFVASIKTARQKL